MENYEENDNIRTDDEIQIIKGDEIDIIALIKAIWNDRKTIIYTTIVVMIIGVMIALFSPVKYSASAVFLPQTEDNTKNLGGQLGSLAGLAGINLGSMMGGASGGISPDIYPNIVNSYPYLNELLTTVISPNDETLYNRIYADTLSGFGYYLLKYTIMLPKTLREKMAKESVLVLNDKSKSLIVISKKDKEIYETVSEMISVDVDIETGLVTVVATMKKDKIAVAIVTQRVLDLLQKYIIDYKTQKIQENLQFIEARFLEAKTRYESIHKEYFEYRAQHRNLVQEMIDFHYQELSNEYNLSLQIYSSLAEQVEQARIAVKEQTPAFSIIEPVKIPVEKISPKRTMIFVISGFLGAFLGILVLLGKFFFGYIKKSW